MSEYVSDEDYILVSFLPVIEEYHINKQTNEETSQERHPNISDVERIKQLVVTPLWYEYVLLYAVDNLTEGNSPIFGCPTFRVTDIETYVDNDGRISFDGFLKEYTEFEKWERFIRSDAIDKTWIDSQCMELMRKQAEESIIEGLWKSTHEGEILLDDKHEIFMHIEPKDVKFQWNR